MKLVLFCISFFCSIYCFCTDGVVPVGTYSNLLSNGKLELFAGNFPQSWRFAGAHAPGYASDGGFNNGGRFIFTKRNVYITIRQDWTFTIVPGEKYRFRAKIRAKNFGAAVGRFFVFNNGWKTSAQVDIPQGSYDWQDFSYEFTGFESRGGYYSTAIRVNKQRSGMLEVSDVCVEPATQSAYEKSTAYLKLIPEIKLVALSPRLDFIPADNAELVCRWFGDKTVKELTYTVGKIHRKAAVKDGVVTLDLSGLKPDNYVVKVTDGKSSTDIKVRIVPGVDTSQVKVLNNLHKVLFEKTLQANEKSSFGNPRNGWVLFTLPNDMCVNVNGKELTNGEFVRLNAGSYDFTVIKGNGKVKISAVTEVSLYAFATGPFFTDIPKQDWSFVQKYMLPYTMNFLGSEASEADVKQLRSGTRKFYVNCKIAAINNAKLNAETPIKTRGMDVNNKNVDGIFIDELAMGSEKPLVYFLKNLPRLTLTPERDVYTYICGNLQNNRFTAKVFADSTNLTAHSYILAELYLPNRYADEKLAEKFINDRLIAYAARLNKMLPGIMPQIGIALCQSNMPLNFSIDHEPEADHRVFLDMQLNAIANNPEFRNIGCINFWGGNYADTSRHRWISALFKHYVFEGKKSMLSDEFGLKLVPGHLKNASFREHLKYWTKSGSVGYGKAADGAIFLKYFNNNNDSSNMAIFTKNQYSAKLNQQMNNLEPGKKYKVRFVISGKGALNLSVDKRPLEVKMYRLDTKRLKTVQNANTTALCEAVFTAEKSSELLEFSAGEAPQGSKINLHFVSVLKEIF